MHMLSFLSGKSEAQEFSFERYCRRIWARKAPGPVVPGRRHQPSLGRRMLHPSTGRFFAQEYRKGDTALRYRFRLPFEEAGGKSLGHGFSWVEPQNPAGANAAKVVLVRCSIATGDDPGAVFPSDL